ncbi:MAG: DUF2892 domain-containing protein [Gemmatimonadales bacterium]
MGTYRNLSAVDAWIRGVLAVGLMVAAGLLHANPAVSLAAALLGLVLIGTALMRHCPIYRLLKLSTARDPSGGRP